MPKHETLQPDRGGRRSGIRRLIYRAPTNNENDGTRRGKGKWVDRRDWSAIKEQLRLTVRRAPEVVIHVKGGRRSTHDDPGANEAVLRYMMYISRNGRLLTIDERGDRIDGAEAVHNTHGTWDLDMQRTRGLRNEPLHPSFNIIFSMPAKIDSEKLLDAVQAFASDRFQGHQYVMALHTPETDPAKDPPAHPHVHLILRAENEDGWRIHIRKTDLRVWREQFAAELRARGIEANATSRAERGKSLRAARGAEWHITRRYNEQVANGKAAVIPTARAARLQEAANELQEGRADPKPWEIAMAARRRDVLRRLVQSVTQLRQEGDVELADQVERFINDMSPLDSERRQLQRALIEQVNSRLHRQDQKLDSAPPDRTT